MGFTHPTWDIAVCCRLTFCKIYYRIQMKIHSVLAIKNTASVISMSNAFLTSAIFYKPLKCGWGMTYKCLTNVYGRAFKILQGHWNESAPLIKVKFPGMTTPSQLTGCLMLWSQEDANSQSSRKRLNCCNPITVTVKMSEGGSSAAGMFLSNVKQLQKKFNSASSPYICFPYQSQAAKQTNMQLKLQTDRQKKRMRKKPSSCQIRERIPKTRDAAYHPATHGHLND